MKKLTLALVLIGYSVSASATRLIVNDDANILLHIGAAVLLYAHIFSGAMGLIAGSVASLSKKGSSIHRKAGVVFLISMLICYLIGAGVAPFLTEGQRPNFVAAILALYLLITGVIAAKRRQFIAQNTEKIGFVIALLITAMGVIFMVMGSQSDTGTVDGSPPQAFILFIVAGSLAAIGDLRAVIKSKLSNTERIIRHIWRMCFSFFIASGSLFFGQPQIFSDWFNESVFPVLLGFFPLFVLLLFILKIKIQSAKVFK